jgi:hypothetical protein
LNLYGESIPEVSLAAQALQLPLSESSAAIMIELQNQVSKSVQNIKEAIINKLITEKSLPRTKCQITSESIVQENKIKSSIQE